MQPTTQRRSRCLFHWAASDFSLKARTGESGTLVRATVGTAQDRHGRFRPQVHSQPRFAMLDLNGDGIAESPVLLVESQRTALLLRSGIQGTVGALPTGFTLFGQDNALVVSNEIRSLDEGFSGLVAKHTRVSSGGGGETDSNCGGQSVTVTASLTYTFSFYVWIPSSFAGTAVLLSVDGTASLVANGSTAADLSKRDQWQRVTCTVTANGTGGSVSAILRITATGDTNFVYSDCWQGESGLFASSWINTDAAAIQRNIELVSFPIAFNPQELSLYVDAVDIGAGRQANGQFAITSAVTLGRNGAGDYDFELRLNANGAERRAQVRLGNAGGTPTQAIGDITSGTFLLGDRMEIVGRMYKDGKIDAQQSINGGSTVTGAKSTDTVPMEAIWGANTIELGGYGSSVGGWAIRSVKVVAGPRTMDETREAA